MDNNTLHCKSIAEELENYYKGIIFSYEGDTYNSDDVEVIDNEEGEECYVIDDELVPVDEVEQLSLYDYFEDVYDIEYRIGSDKEFRSVQLMVACGGPNIFIDTATKQVELYWWSERASYMIDSDVCEEINSIYEEYFNC